MVKTVVADLSGRKETSELLEVPSSVGVGCGLVVLGGVGDNDGFL